MSSGSVSSEGASVGRAREARLGALGSCRRSFLPSGTSGKVETVLQSKNIITQLLQEEIPPQIEVCPDARSLDNALEVVGHRFAEDFGLDPMSEEGVGQDISSSNKGGDLVGEARGEFPVDSRSTFIPGSIRPCVACASDARKIGFYRIQSRRGGRGAIPSRQAPPPRRVGPGAVAARKTCR
jgi:hypothetical protein